MARSAEDRAPNHRGLSTDMCGIAGLYNTSGRPVDLHVLEAMTQVQAHRGPDGEGYALMTIGRQEKPFSVRGQLQDSLASGAHPYAVGFGHRRLAIVDLTLGGHQPMATPDERCWVTYNGEIYNYLELRDELRAHGHRFRSGSDTEVLLAAYRQWGEDCVRRFNGMFAFALWDGDRRRLFCARDRLGEKPFYYHWNGEQFAFASEIKGLLAAGVRPSPNHRAMYDYLEGGALDYGDATFFENVRQLPPAHCLILDGQRLALARYWDVPPGGEGPSRSPRETAAQFRDLLRDAVRLRLRSDVPIGTCLSGGLDSSSIVCVANELMFGDHPEVSRELVGERQKTFSACFDDPAYDERRFIRPVLDRTGAESYYAFPDPKEFAATLLQLIWQQDEPFGSTSVFAQWNVMRLASRTGVKVALDGQGADELLTGNGLRALLHYEDRNSMAFGIEARLPFLDYRVVEFLSGVDPAYKIRLGWTKAVLRDAMEGILPDEVRWRVDKMGFVTPEHRWFRTSLREMAREILTDARTRARGYLNVDAALRAFDAHVAGRKNIGATIWRWLNLELWCRRFLDQHPCNGRSS